MKTRVYKIFSILILITCAAGAYAAEGQSVLRRFGLFIGSNDGGSERVTLAYAVSDATSVATVLHEMGGLSDADTIILKNLKEDDIDIAFNAISNEIARARGTAKRIEFVLYYSGHSSEEGLLLGDDVLTYRELRNKINLVNADVNIGILDSCYSGAFTRLKGGTRQSPFMIDESTDARGHAFLTSSSEDEAAQESDAIGASFFTYYLVAALRGAADASLDQKVSLNEAYTYASNETRARTEYTQAGPQNPEYAFNLSGAGELVLTDLRISDAGIQLTESLNGRLFIRNSANQLMAEVRKPAGMPVNLSFPQGDYRISLETETGLFEAHVTLYSGNRFILSEKQFSEKNREWAIPRGDGGAEEFRYVDLYNPISPFGNPSSGKTRYIHHNLSVALIGSAYQVKGIQAGLLNFVDDRVDGIQYGHIINSVGGTMEGIQISPIYNSADKGVDGFQASGVINITGGNNYGGQFAGVLNLNTGSINGIQMAGVFNMNQGGSHGFQASGVFNMNSSASSGGQMAGVFNHTDAVYNGAQMSGVYNYSGRHEGVQLSVVNVSGDVKGAQVGIINIGRDIKGSQIGIVNISRDHQGIPVGLFNFSQTGILSLSGWVDDMGYGYGGLQFGTRNFYTLIYGGSAIEAPGTTALAGLGMGVELPLNPLFLNLDISQKTAASGSSWEESVPKLFNPETASLTPVVRVLGGIKAIGNIRIMGGVIVEGVFDGLTGNRELFSERTPWQTVDMPAQGIHGELYATYFLGLRL